MFEEKTATQTVLSLRVHHSQVPRLIQSASAYRQLEVFELDWTHITSGQVLELLQQLSTKGTLRKLRLVAHALNRQPFFLGSEALRAMAGLARLRTLELRYCQLGDAEAETLAELASRSLQRLEELDLTANYITDRGAVALARCLEGHPSLRCLSASAGVGYMFGFPAFW